MTIPMRDEQVLIWNKNYGKEGKAVVHRNESCPSISNKNPPARSDVYPERRGTAGWVPLSRARQLRHEGKARDCSKCL
jgi:hypothetical protein